MTAYPLPADPAVSKRMKANGRRDSRAGSIIRSALHRHGLRFFVDRPVQLSDRIVRPDIVFPRARLAVFIDGCYWHACPNHGTQPRRNREYWEPKLRRNVERDREVDAGLQQSGWLSLRFWEHELPDSVVPEVLQALCERLG